MLTNKPEAPTRRLLDAFELTRAFAWIVGGDSPFPRKPDPAAVRHLMHEANATPDATLLVGDSSVDVETARRAGVRVCVARYGFGALRGDMPAGAGDFAAADPPEVGAVIERFVEALPV